MLSSNRGHYVAIGGCLAFLLLAIPALGQAPESAGTAEGEPAESSAPASPAENSKPEPTASEPESAPTEQPAQPDSTADAEGENNYYAREDLKAQQDMARATDAIAFLTKVQIGLGVVGTILLVVTLWETRRATNLATSTAQSQLRAYLDVSDSIREQRKPADPWFVKITFVNKGQTPAYNIRLFMAHALIRAEDVGTFDFVEPTPPIQKGDLGPNQDFTVRIEIPVLGRYFPQFKKGEAHLYAWGRLRFVDAFGSKRWIQFRLFQKGSYILNMEFCEEGNNSSESQEFAKQSTP